MMTVRVAGAMAGAAADWAESSAPTRAPATGVVADPVRTLERGAGAAALAPPSVADLAASASGPGQGA